MEEERIGGRELLGQGHLTAIVTFGCGISQSLVTLWEEEQISQLHWLLAIPYTGQVCFRLRVLALCFFGLEHCTHTKLFSPASRVLLTCHLCTEVPPTTLLGKRPSHH